MDITKQLTLTTMWAAVSTAIVVIGLLAKFFKDWSDVVAGFKRFWKGIGLFSKWLFRFFIFRADVLAAINEIKEDLKDVKHEVQYNGNSSMKDAVKRIELGQQELKGLVISNKKVREIADMYDDKMIFRMNGEAACTFINDAFLKFFGWQEHEVLDFSYENLVHHDHVADMRNKWQMAINRHSKFYDEQLICDSKGECHLCAVKASPILQGDGLEGFYGTIELIKR